MKRKQLLMIIVGISAMLTLGGCGAGSDLAKEANPVAAEENPLAGTYMPDFATTTIDGEPIDSNLFYESELTMINVWGTFCGPCIEEMPDLERLSQDLKKDNIRVIGVVVDDDLDAAKEILAGAGVTFTNLVMDANLEATLGNFQYVPTTIFVDGKGEVMPEIVVGAGGYEDYKALARAALQSATTVQAGSGGS